MKIQGVLENIDDYNNGNVINYKKLNRKIA